MRDRTNTFKYSFKKLPQYDARQFNVNDDEENVNPKSTQDYHQKFNSLFTGNLNQIQGACNGNDPIKVNAISSYHLNQQHKTSLFSDHIQNQSNLLPSTINDTNNALDDAF